MKRYDSIPGTRDFYPDTMHVRRWIEARWREVSLRYGFEEYDAPLMEPLALFTDKSGDEISEQLYAFTDRGDRQVALRPEMTPSLARMVAARGAGLPKPIKWFSIPRLFRYERPQRGRFREFWQLNLDILGVGGESADAEIIAAGVDSLRACGLSEQDFEVRYSDRRLLDGVLEGLGVPGTGRDAVYAALDRLARVGDTAVVDALRAAGLDGGAAGALVEAVAGRSIDGVTRLGIEPDVLEPHRVRLGRLAELLEAYGVGAYCAFDLSVVRGLAYYTGVVFEMYDRRGELRALCGGGRYDDLLEAVGGPQLPAVGFGLGEAVLVELLEQRGRLPAPSNRCEAFVVPVSEADRVLAVTLASRLRAGGVATDIALREQSVGKALKSAAQSGARFAIVIGERERESGQATVRDLIAGEESVFDIDAAVTRIEETVRGGER